MNGPAFAGLVEHREVLAQVARLMDTPFSFEFQRRVFRDGKSTWFVTFRDPFDKGEDKIVTCNADTPKGAVDKGLKELKKRRPAGVVRLGSDTEMGTMRDCPECGEKEMEAVTYIRRGKGRGKVEWHCHGCGFDERT